MHHLAQLPYSTSPTHFLLELFTDHMTFSPYPRNWNFRSSMSPTPYTSFKCIHLLIVLKIEPRASSMLCFVIEKPCSCESFSYANKDIPPTVLKLKLAALEQESKNWKPTRSSKCLQRKKQSSSNPLPWYCLQRFGSLKQPDLPILTRI